VAARFREGEIGFERISQDFTSELAYIVEVERWQAKVGGSRDISSGALRVTSVLHPEDGTWKVLHRHADPISPIPPPT
jgi:hypothetical protein